jgi:hypothetical protein
MRRRPALAAASAAAVALLFAAPARAETFCVQDASCTGTPQPGLQSALDAAAVNVDDRDTIRIGPVALTEAATDGSGNKVDIVGAGADRTSISAAGVTPLSIQEPSSTVTGLEVKLTSGVGKIALSLSGSATDVAVTAAPEVTASVGVSMSGGATFRRGSVAMSTAGDLAENDGFLISGDPNTGQKTIEGATVVASNGVRVATPLVLARFVTVRGVRITARNGVRVENGQAFVDDVLVRGLPSVPGSGATGLSALQSPTKVAALRATHVTAIGPSPAGPSTGAVATGGGALEVRNSILRGFEKDVRNELGSTLTVDRSDFETSEGTVGGAGNTTAPPSFVDPAGDFRLRWDSPLIDAGGAFGGPDTDVDGNPRTVNGAPDIGAFEYQRRPPVPSIGVAIGSPRTGDPVGFDGSGSSDPDPGDAPLSLAWSFDDGGAASGPSVAHVFSTAGLLPPVPSITAFSVTNPKPKAKKGTTFRYTLSAAARTVKVSFDSLVPGKKSGRSCVKPTKKLVRAKGCTRTVAKGGISGPAAAGKNSLAWDARIKRKALPAGRYRATARGTDRFGRLTNAKTLAFTLVASR